MSFPGGLSYCWLRGMASEFHPIHEKRISRTWALLNSPVGKLWLSGCFTSPVLQRQCSGDMLNKGKTGSLLSPFSIWRDDMNMQCRSLSPYALKSVYNFELRWIAECDAIQVVGFGAKQTDRPSMISNLWITSKCQSTLLGPGCLLWILLENTLKRWWIKKLLLEFCNFRCIWKVIYLCNLTQLSHLIIIF